MLSSDLFSSFISHFVPIFCWFIHSTLCAMFVHIFKPFECTSTISFSPTGPMWSTNLTACPNVCLFTQYTTVQRFCQISHLFTCCTPQTIFGIFVSMCVLTSICPCLSLIKLNYLLRISSYCGHMRVDLSCPRHLTKTGVANK